MPYGQFNIIWFALAAILAIAILMRVGKWYGGHLHLKKSKAVVTDSGPAISRRRVIISLIILLALIFSKYFYMASMTSYFTFYMIDKFHVSVQQSQIYLFAFLAAVAAGTIMAGRWVTVLEESILSGYLF